MSASTTADAESPSAIVRWAQTRRPRRDSEDSVKSKLELAIRRAPAKRINNSFISDQANAFLKTKMCPKLRMNADGLWSCPQGDRCSFAHSESELRLLPNLTKTAICYEQVYGKCGCKNGALCKYAHSEEELRNYVPLGAPHGRQYNNNRHGSGGSVSGSKRKSSQTCEVRKYVHG
ncbi:hypothetical protein Pmar_PMAR012616 [Perkinsus marinus ATCC 50983]|uniref:C3H1-type domain-containing protein n=1 Tax=Perkinsus marinus (strain ATCC 50983 / TXsc) TaxID=423536 RepID=C5K7U9_PERM5|nr:hypothetical protein Pmar_PMAR012616 [Perkinsus marinus ATCC 50983]EER19634.1 hypothetical protein Pmar_PMAR012616 [Perkinsus marinus ATCC 50983]|eukprot:XP_002787838.1 hypothetical protein Pmar_PMAR012616 [Perkinsus marinus ATCC 50983]